jgi:hypothetical protein
VFKFDPDTLYGLEELREQLSGMVELTTFLDRLGLREKRVFRDALWGWEILQAARGAEPFSGSAVVRNQAVVKVTGTTRTRTRPSGVQRLTPDSLK